MNPNVLIKLTENDKRVIIALLFAIILLFVIIGLLGSLIVRTMKWQGKKCDTLVSDVVTNHIVKTPHQLRKYAAKKNIRHFLKQAWIPIIIILVGVATICIRNAITKDWSYDLLNYNNGTPNQGGTGIGTLLFIWDFKDQDSYTKIWGLTLLAKWPPLINEPHFSLPAIVFIRPAPRQDRLCLYGCPAPPAHCPRDGSRAAVLLSPARAPRPFPYKRCSSRASGDRTRRARSRRRG